MNQPSVSTRLLLLGLVLLGAPLTLSVVACRTTQRAERARADDAAPVHSAARRAWQLVDGDRIAGWVILFREEGEAAREFYSVRNEFQQELGLIDAQGRAWRYRPFEAEPEHVGTSTVVEGARLILGSSVAGRLVEVSLAELSISR